MRQILLTQNETKVFVIVIRCSFYIGIISSFQFSSIFSSNLVKKTVKEEFLLSRFSLVGHMDVINQMQQFNVL